MPSTVEAMTLREILEAHGIHTIRELSRRANLKRQHAWNLWHGYAGVGKATITRLHDALGIPLEELMQIDPVPNKRTPRRKRQEEPKLQPRRGRPRRQPPQE